MANEERSFFEKARGDAVGLWDGLITRLQQIINSDDEKVSLSAIKLASELAIRLASQNDDAEIDRQIRELKQRMDELR
jgi:hypothetical protein